MGKRVGLLTEKLRKIYLIYFAGFKCALEDYYKHQHIDIHSFKVCAENRIWAGIIGTVITALRTAARSLSP